MNRGGPIRIDPAAGEYRDRIRTGEAIEVMAKVGEEF
jgi:hypothetical protein